MGTGAKSVGSALGVVAAAGAATLAWGTLIERNAYRVRHEILPVLDAGASPIRVLHISDLHMAPWQTAKQDWVRGLASLTPDLVVNTGDNLGHVDGLIGVRRALEVFDGIPGVFVHGSNDYYGPTGKNPLAYFSGPSHRPEKAAELDTEALNAFFGELGWVDLNNAAHSMIINDSPLEFMGTADAHRGWDRLDMIPGALDELREADPEPLPPTMPADREAVTIGVTHAPYQRVLDSFVTHGAEVIFAGHTHGGQVCVPGVGALVTNCDLPRDMASGVSLWRHALGSAYLEVSAGLGTSIYAPVRFACPPEAVLVTLVGSDISYS
ncbi:metallophosphoesterase [Salinibacterium hongtaonis]|uniref:Metallophosphoesterase n=1 Tax=Homoserinimonas hongtaonis TaxID=2079791 RepID=A0A2U1T0G6_9MICO|nr:metallophosphoesterase [Salinibacterium hongtaonis]AWB89886.1 metallophosphatase [Salinibacterium hongtaonis]PWB97349.1 metallophosphoesterase [Salinibacterium hongtaonis]